MHINDDHQRKDDRITLRGHHRKLTFGERVGLDRAILMNTVSDQRYRNASVVNIFRTPGRRVYCCRTAAHTRHSPGWTENVKKKHNYVRISYLDSLTKGCQRIYCPDSSVTYSNGTWHHVVACNNIITGYWMLDVLGYKCNFSLTWDPTKSTP